MRLIIVCALVFTAPALAEKPATPAVAVTPGSAPAGADWSPDRATGPRDVFALGDSVNAWATAQADSGPEWLELGFGEKLSVAEVRIWQNDAPGAIARVTVVVDGEPVEVWSGTDAPPTAPEGPVEKVVRLAKPYLTDTVTVHLDTRRVSGWNEIDAVEVVTADGRRAWAKSARASSTYASAAPVHPLGHLVGKPVRVRVDGIDVTGTLTAVDHTWLTIDDGSKRRLVAASAVAFIEWTR